MCGRANPHSFSSQALSSSSSSTRRLYFVCSASAAPTSAAALYRGVRRAFESLKTFPSYSQAGHDTKVSNGWYGMNEPTACNDDGPNHSRTRSIGRAPSMLSRFLLPPASSSLACPLPRGSHRAATAIAIQAVIQPTASLTSNPPKPAP